VRQCFGRQVGSGEYQPIAYTPGGSGAVKDICSRTSWCSERYLQQKQLQIIAGPIGLYGTFAARSNSTFARLQHL
jgi:hypothetical protein